MPIALRPLRNPNPLGFPGGVLPGFDTSHVAAQGAQLSAVSLGASFYDLLGGGKGTIGGAPTSVIIGNIGPAVKFAATPDNVGVAGKSTTAFAANTLACIFSMNATTTQQAFLALGTNGTNATYPWIGTNGAGSALLIFAHQGAAAVTAITAALNTPYFLVASENQSGTAAVNIVVTNLLTGQVSTFTSTQAYTAGSRNGTFNIGARGAGNLFALSNIACAMASNRFLSMPQLLQWAQDPWAFWYPRTLDLTRMIVGASAATFKPAWAMNSNLPVLGTGTY